MKVAICCAKSEHDLAQQVYYSLKERGVQAWLASEDLTPGQNWSLEIDRQIKASDLVIAIISAQSMDTRGYLHKELRTALDIMETLPPGKLFLIPARADECMPCDPRLTNLQWVDLFPSYEEGLKKLLRSLSLNYRVSPPAAMSNVVLLVDDAAGSIGWIIDFLEWRGYAVDWANNEAAAKEKLDSVGSGAANYVLAIFDIMLPTRPVDSIEDIDVDFFMSTQDAGIRLCLYAREILGIPPNRLPIICISARDDPEVRSRLADLQIPFFHRQGEEAVSFLNEKLPNLS